MATKQKSFFDQDKKVNTQRTFRPQYQRTRSAGDSSHSGNSPTRPTMTKPGIPPGSQTTKKLKAFQFIDGRPSGQRAADLLKENKENEVCVEKASANPKPTAQHTPLKSSSQPDPADRRLPPPSTPAPRLPLADLLGNADPNKKVGVLIDTPEEEQVLWKHVRSPGSSQPAVTPARKRKRAKSSSPISSQQEQSDFFVPNKDPKAKTTSFTTPLADPAADLWMRYANANDGTSLEKSIAFAHLIREPSPKSPASVGSIGGLRRWASCGIEWPQSAKKRRKLSRRVDELARENETPQNPGRVSSVEALLERMKETLQSKTVEDMAHAPSSSQPLPDRHTDQESRLSPIVEAREHGRVAIPKEDVLRVQLAPKNASSQYGDDDMDNEMMHAMESTSKVAPPDPPKLLQRTQLSHKGLKKPFKVPTITHKPPPKPALPPPPTDDEFGDDDDDLLDVDLSVVVSNFDSQTKIPTQAADHVVAPLSHSVLAEPLVEVISDDEFGDDDIDEEQFAAIEAAATQAYQATQGGGPSECDTRTIQRYLVKSVQECLYEEPSGRRQMQKVLLVDDSKTQLTRSIFLRQSWIETNATIGSYVHIMGTFNVASECVIDNANNILVLHPDHLISATVVADSFGCVRRAVLQDRVKATGEASPPMMYGHILHELFQEAMKTNDWADDAFGRYMAQILPRHYETMVEIGLNLNQVHEHLRSKFPEMRAWAELFVQPTPGRDAVIKGRNGQQAVMSINKLLEVEEHIWSPNYGLKGNVDATIQATIRDGSSSRVLTMPFELKTGKRMNEHHVAQTALYTLLASDRYDVEITEGILYYLENSNITRVQAIRHELIHLIMKRNELACYVRERLQLPPMLPESRQRLCNNCYAQNTCFLYHKLSEDGTSKTIANKGRFDELVKYLKPVDQQFFRKWDHLLTKEESEMKKFTRELWTMLSREREKKGRCFGNVIIEPGSARELAAASKINRYQYTFVKEKQAAGFSFAESQITVGEPIVVSDEKGHYALANGYVTHVHKKRITVAVDRRLHNARARRPGFDSQTNQDFIGVMEALSSQDPIGDPILYRLDKDEFSNGMATARSNILQIMDDTVYKAADLRALIVQDRSPRFRPPSTAVALQQQAWQADMNTDQKAAVEKVMAAQDYALVLGMPGTGKTTTIAQIIRALVAQGKSVLLTSYTHTAVDNILLKIRDAGFDILRLGVLAKIHPEVQEFAILAAQQKESLEEVHDAWEKPQVVATTCLGVNHPLFGKRTFDYCIVDEASQITLPVCLGPIRMARTFVLVGDHFQLPPLVQNKEAQEGGLDMSLFRLLSERHPNAVVNLEHQYRMCADIMHLSNSLIYSGRLKCGTPTVAAQSLRPPRVQHALSIHHFPSSAITQDACPGASPTCPLNPLLSPSNRVLFFNTDPIGPSARELLSGGSNRITNPLEINLTAQFVTALMSAGTPPSSIGVITFYRSQLSSLRQTLRAAVAEGVEMHTADKFQGRDKDVVVVSIVRSNEDSQIGELLKDWRRINVAVTRARSKLVMIGSRSTLEKGGAEVLKGLVDVCAEKGWIHDLRQGVDIAHSFPELATQATASVRTQGQGGLAEQKSPTKDMNKQGRKALAPLGAARMNQKNGARVPEKTAKIGKRALFGNTAAGYDDGKSSRPVLRDVFHDVVGGFEDAFD